MLNIIWPIFIIGFGILLLFLIILGARLLRSFFKPKILFSKEKMADRENNTIFKNRFLLIVSPIK